MVHHPSRWRAVFPFLLPLRTYLSKDLSTTRCVSTPATMHLLWLCVSGFVLRIDGDCQSSTPRTGIARAKTRGIKLEVLHCGKSLRNWS